MKTALTIAGSDSSGGAGIQADIKTMTANGVYAMSAVTALTAQNTTGVYGILESTPEFLASQLDCIFTDIFPDAVKTGMVASTGLIEVIADKLKQYKAKNIVVDPVMVATSGSRLISQEAVDALKELLLPLATVLTPNIPEAEVLSGLTISGPADMEKAAQAIGEAYGCAVLCKGGHDLNDANDLLWRAGTCKWFHGRRIDNPNTHGTSGPRPTCPELWRPCWTWGRDRAPWTTFLISRGSMCDDLSHCHGDFYRGLSGGCVSPPETSVWPVSCPLPPWCCAASSSPSPTGATSAWGPCSPSCCSP